MTTPDDIVAAARSMLGTPYHHQGRKPRVGLDCIGLIVAVGEAVGITLQDRHAYAPHGNGNAVDDGFGSQFDEVPLDEAQSGDVLTFRLRPGGCSQHAAILTDRGIVHTFQHLRRVVEHSYADPWPKRAVKAYRWRVQPEPR